MRALQHVFRRLGRAPTFTAIALLTLALGIGANTAIFSVVNGVLIKPLPYPQAQELVSVWQVAPGITSIDGNINCSPSMYFTYREENRTFQEFGLWSSGGASVTGVAEPEQLQALVVTYGTLQALGVQPVLGRWFSEADDTPGSADTVMLTYGYWQRRFGGDKSVIGRTLTIDSRPRTVIGVMPRDFRFLNTRPRDDSAAALGPQQGLSVEFQLPGHRPPEARRHPAAGQCRCRAHAPHLAPGLAAAARIRPRACSRTPASVPTSSP